MVSDPNIAIALIALGLLGIYAEFCFIGKVVPGILGGIAFLVGLASLFNAPDEAHLSIPFATTVTITLLAISSYVLRIAVRARRNKRLDRWGMYTRHHGRP